MNLKNQSFSHGHWYAGCLCVGKPSHLFVYTPDNKKTSFTAKHYNENKTDNYRELWFT